ncbi:hypothetical protein CCYA_CCYA05G1672 [Cyanidiococcus yangmingshanensis]|nr:hypothetical protein CCYA_CCYA05G1672 [Cyanidiococcus yangmingshanensis]
MPASNYDNLSWVSLLNWTPTQCLREPYVCATWRVRCPQRALRKLVGVRWRPACSRAARGGSWLHAHAAGPPEPPDNDDQDEEEFDWGARDLSGSERSSAPSDGYEAHVRERLRDWRAFRMQLVRQELDHGGGSKLNEVAGQDFQQETRSATDLTDEQKPMEMSAAEARFRARPSHRAGSLSSSLELDCWGRSGLELRWVHPVTTLETGNILVASPFHFRNEQQYFAHTVILILEHSVNGTTGVILNRRAAQRISMVRSLAGTDLARVFARDALYLGGPVGLDSLLVLHDESVLAMNGDPLRSSAEGNDCAYEIVPGGVYCGGLGRLTELAQNGLLTRPERIHFFCGYCGWEPGQLQAEIDQGVWYVASASAELILGPRVPVESVAPRTRQANAEAGNSPFGFRERPRSSVNAEDNLAALGAQAVPHAVESPMTLWREVIQKLTSYRQLMDGFPGSIER